MRIWLIEIGEPLAVFDPRMRDWRCALLAKAFVASGHTVTWWVSTFDHLTKRYYFDGPRVMDVPSGYSLRLLHAKGYSRNRSPRRFIYHRAIARAFSHEVRYLSTPDLIFCLMPIPELAEQAVVYGRQVDVPVVVEIHDLWPDHYLSLVPHFLRPFFKLALLSEYRRVQRIMKGATGIQAISEQYLRWGLGYAGRARNGNDSVFPLGYPSISSESSAQIDKIRQDLVTQYKLKPTDVIIAFVGTFTASFDLGTVIEAARVLQHNKERAVRFVLVGDGDLRSELQAEAQELDNVAFTGWFDQASITAILSLSSAGIAPYKDDTQISLPNKPFEYMAAGLPLLSSLPGELEQLIGEERIGLQYQAGDIQSLVEKIVWLTEHPAERAAMGQRARKLFEERFRADIIYPRLVAHLEQVAANATAISSGKSLMEKGGIMAVDYSTVTELAGDEISQEQIERLCHRYYWAGTYCVGKDAIEAACGTGPGLGYLAARARSLHAGDFTPGILAIAQGHYGNRVDLRQFDAQAMPFEDHSADVVILFEAIYYLPSAGRFVDECRRVLRPGGQVLIATANNDLYDFNPSPYSHVYYGVVELNRLFTEHDFAVECFGYHSIRDVSLRQKVLRPVKKLAADLGLIPKTMEGKRWLKRIVFGRPTTMPAEIAKGMIPYKEPTRLPLSKPDSEYKVIYCVATMQR